MRGGHRAGEFRARPHGLKKRLLRSGVCHATIRTGMCASRIAHFSPATVAAPSCRMPAMSAASAPASEITSQRCAALPAPPLAITGTVTAFDTAWVNFRSYPVPTPSQSMLVRRISPAPLETHSRAHSTASRSVRTRAPDVDARDDALRAETPRSLGQDRRPVHGRRIDAHLVSAGAQRARHVVDRANSAAGGQRNEQPLRRAAREIEDRPARFAGRADVEKDDLVGALPLVALGKLDRIADVPQSLELHTLHDPSPRHVEADDHTAREAHRRRPRPARVRNATLPLVLSRSPVSASACASEKPSALNAASTTWWRSSPRR